jgi:hypothetical protein
MNLNLPASLPATASKELAGPASEPTARVANRLGRPDFDLQARQTLCVPQDHRISVLLKIWKETNGEPPSAEERSAFNDEPWRKILGTERIRDRFWAMPAS